MRNMTESQCMSSWVSFGEQVNMWLNLVTVNNFVRAFWWAGMWHDSVTMNEFVSAFWIAGKHVIDLTTVNEFVSAFLRADKHVIDLVTMNEFVSAFWWAGIRHDSVIVNEFVKCDLPLIQMWYASFKCDMPHSHVTCLMTFLSDMSQCDMPLIQMSHASFKRDMPHVNVTCLIQMWHASWHVSLTCVAIQS